MTKAVRINPDYCGDIPVLQRKWSAAAFADALPPFEEVMLGSLGQLSDHLMLMERDSSGAFRMMRAGRAAREWCGDAADSSSLERMSPDVSAVLRHALDTAIALQRPYHTQAYRLDGGSVLTCDILTMPVSCRWGLSLCAAYLRPREASSNLLEMMYETASEGVMSLAALRDSAGAIADFQIVEINSTAATLLNGTPDALRWGMLGSCTATFAGADVADRMRSALDERRAERFELCWEENGHRRCFAVQVNPMHDLLSVMMYDVTEMKQREDSFRLLFDANPVPMWIFDPDRLRFLAVNDAGVAHYGYSRESFLEMSVTDLWPQDQAWEHLQAVVKLPDNYQSQRSWRHLRADGSEIEVLTFGRRVVFDGSSAFLVSIWDITERRRAEQKIAHMAHHDALTGLPNRVLYQQHLDEALSRAKRMQSGIAVLCLDLDEFKAVNDTMGHPAGDLLLQHVADRLREEAENYDLVARLGGDEFAIIVEQTTSPQTIAQLAARIVETIGRPYDIGGADVVVGTSIGVAMSPHDGETPEDLIRNADIALYRAKAAGRNNYQFFEKEMDRALQARRGLASDLRKAFAAGEFEVHYQPLIDLQNDRLSAFEALIRWRHPQRGMVSPADFIPVLEEMGLIVQVGEWVLHQACREATSWPDDIRIAVNLSPVQFRGGGLVQSVVAVLAHSGLDAARLELEITESVLLAETGTNLDVLHRLRSLGVRVLMDDFGTGYSSLGYLRSFPFDKIKIDRSFVSDMASRPDCLAIVRAVIGLGKSLGVTTTAEGVENEEQASCLKLEGCHEVQGFLFSRPQPAAALPALIDKLGARKSRAA